jgi:hypothetical protein
MLDFTSESKIKVGDARDENREDGRQGLIEIYHDYVVVDFSMHHLEGKFEEFFFPWIDEFSLLSTGEEDCNIDKLCVNFKRNHYEEDFWFSLRVREATPPNSPKILRYYEVDITESVVLFSGVGVNKNTFSAMDVLNVCKRTQGTRIAELVFSYLNPNKIVLKDLRGCLEFAFYPDSAYYNMSYLVIRIDSPSCPLFWFEYKVYPFLPKINANGRYTLRI